MRIVPNYNYSDVEDSYLFYKISEKLKKYKEDHDREVIDLSIGDVTLPLPQSVINAIHSAIEEQTTASGFRGYPPGGGYGFLRKAISDKYKKWGIGISDDEVFVSSSAKSDAGSILEVCGDNTVYVTVPSYPVYSDAALMAGRRCVYITARREDGFMPLPDPQTMETGIYYLCSPNNPTGVLYSRSVLEKWVHFAINSGSLIVFDAAYEAFIPPDDDTPHSIFSIEGAKQCAVELCSFSKTAGFTGLRCAYSVIPSELCFGHLSFNKLWRRRQSTRENGVSYIIQRAAEASLSEEGERELRGNILYYMKNAELLRDFCIDCGIDHSGGISSPYVFMKLPFGKDSWDCFDIMLNNAGVVVTPGAGFGNAGEGYIRLTAFKDHDSTAKAIENIKALL